MTRLRVVLDSNIYRGLGQHAFRSVSANEARQGVEALASHWVAIELMAHLASTEDPGFGPCWAGLKRLWSHCCDDAEENLRFLADSENQVCHLLFDRHISNREEEAKTHGHLVGTIANASSPTDWSQLQPQLDHLASHVPRMEKQFVADIWQHVVLAVEPDAGSWQALAQSDSPMRQQLLQHLDEPVGLEMCARMIIAKAVHQLQMPEDQVDFDDKLRVILDVFETPLKLYTGIVRRVVADGPDLTKKKRSNWIWDIQICFSTSSYARIGDVPIWLVTKDDAMLVAASESNTRQVVRTPEEYFKLLASPADDFRSAVEASATAV